MRVVIVPAPASRGNTRGTMEWLLPPSSVSGIKNLDAQDHFHTDQKHNDGTRDSKGRYVQAK